MILQKTVMHIAAAEARAAVLVRRIRRNVGILRGSMTKARYAKRNRRHNAHLHSMGSPADL